MTGNTVLNVMTKNEAVEKLVETLTNLTDLMVLHRTGKLYPALSHESVSSAECSTLTIANMSLPSEDQSPTDDEWFIRSINLDPMGQSFKASIRRVGEILNRIGGLDLMQEVANTAAGNTSLGGKGFSYRMDVIDKSFDGVGGWCA